VAPRLLTSIEGEPLLIEDLTARRAELREELTEISNQSEGWLREEIDERVTKRFLGRAFLGSSFFHRQELKRLLADARELLKERTTRLATDAERSKLLQAVETAATLPTRRRAHAFAPHTADLDRAARHLNVLMLALMLVQHHPGDFLCREVRRSLVFGFGL